MVIPASLLDESASIAGLKSVSLKSLRDGIRSIRSSQSSLSTTPIPLPRGSEPRNDAPSGQTSRNEMLQVLSTSKDALEMGFPGYDASSRTPSIGLEADPWSKSLVLSLG